VAAATNKPSDSARPSTGRQSPTAAGTGRKDEDTDTDATSSTSRTTALSSSADATHPRTSPHGSAASSASATEAGTGESATSTTAPRHDLPTAPSGKDSITVSAPVVETDQSTFEDTAEVKSKSDRIAAPVSAKTTLAATPSVDAFAPSALLVPSADALLGVPVLGLGGLLSSTLSGLAGLTGGIPLLGPVLGQTVGVVSSTTVVVTGAAAILFGAPIVGFLNVGAGISSGFGDLALLTGNVPVAFGAKAFAIGFQTAAQGFMFFGIY
jgi:hypothetical protein